MNRNDIPEPEEPPDPVTATVVTGIISAGAGIGGSLIAANAQKKAAKAAANIKPQMLPGPPAAQPLSSPQVGGDDDGKLKPGQKLNLINTSPQGVLDSATTRRQTLLGG